MELNEWHSYRDADAMTVLKKQKGLFAVTTDGLRIKQMSEEKMWSLISYLADAKKLWQERIDLLHKRMTSTSKEDLRTEHEND